MTQDESFVTFHRFPNIKFQITEYWQWQKCVFKFIQFFGQIKHISSVLDFKRYLASSYESIGWIYASVWHIFRKMYRNLYITNSEFPCTTNILTKRKKNFNFTELKFIVVPAYLIDIKKLIFNFILWRTIWKGRRGNILQYTNHYLLCNEQFSLQGEYFSVSVSITKEKQIIPFY